MIIKNKKTSKEYSITPAQWELFKKTNKHLLFSVVSNETVLVKNVPVPEIITEFAVNRKIDRPQRIEVPTETPLSKKSRKNLKQ